MRIMVFSRGPGLYSTRRLVEAAAARGLSFDAMNSNTFADAKGQLQSYKFGSLSHADKATRDQAIEHNLECIEIGKTIGSNALTVWIGDGSNFPGQVNFANQFGHYLDSMKSIYYYNTHKINVILILKRCKRRMKGRDQ